MESRLTQAVLPLVGLAAENVTRDRYISLLPVNGSPFLTRYRFSFAPVPTTPIARSVRG
ncbi:MAG: hypothetical protein ACQESR_19655 [Planctomycetota bacterium]